MTKADIDYKDRKKCRFGLQSVQKEAMAQHVTHETHHHRSRLAGENLKQTTASTQLRSRFDVDQSDDLHRPAAALHVSDTYGDWSGWEEDRLERRERVQLGSGDEASRLNKDVALEYRRVRLERVILVGMWGSERTRAEAEESLRELADLARTSGAEVLETLVQHKEHPDPATYLGRGKADELAQSVAALRADTVIVDSELAPSQRRALEDVVDAKVIDRTALILDIFAIHASSAEGKAQVELAQLEYLLPRLRGWGESMSRQAGGRVAGGAGIGSRGPGETQIELDRRRIRERMSKLKREIKRLHPARVQQRRQRRKNGVPSVVIVGYTNAGKSSLLNRLTGAGVLVENQLFATLDTTVRKIEMPDHRDVTIADTVGFIRNLPTQLVQAFRSTLDAASEADVLLHVVDASHPDPHGQIRAVHDVLKEVPGAADAREIIVLTKADIASPVDIAALRGAYPDAVVISNVTGEGFSDLLRAISEALPHPRVEINTVIPYEHGDLVSRIHQDGELLSGDEYLAEGTHVHARVDEKLAHAISSALIAPRAEEPNARDAAPHDAALNDAEADGQMPARSSTQRQ
ncbi:MAG: GTPase HflX [Actinomycetaceae bacterium]|nr:GTPase HflX [Actinomycetaceae bacterium]MDY6083018.1 GTPase HflX [Actinomycetaceae bacterium]